jgi:hypothetical protein
MIHFLRIHPLATSPLKAIFFYFIARHVMIVFLKGLDELVGSLYYNQVTLLPVKV